MTRQLESTRRHDLTDGGDQSLLSKLRAKGVGITVSWLKDGQIQPCEIYLEKSGGLGGGGKGYEEVC